jgi:neutral ceramidase
MAFRISNLDILPDALRSSALQNLLLRLFKASRTVTVSCQKDAPAEIVLYTTLNRGRVTFSIMKTNAGNRIALAFLSIMVVLSFAGCASHPKSAVQPVKSSPWQAGMAEIDITPPIGYRMAGYFDERLSTGTHDPLKAKAIVLQQGRREIALVFCDLIGLSLDVTRAVSARASRATGIPVTNIVIAATHSHTGPLFDDVRSDYFHQAAVAKYGGDPQETMDYPAFLTNQLVQVIVKARASLQPAELDAGVTTQPGMPFNRRFFMKNGTVVFNPGKLNPNIIGPAGPVDSDVGILLVKNAKSAERIGGLTVFAMHADTVGGTKFSADYPYFIEQTLRSAYGPDYISAFGAGTCCDLNHIDVSTAGPVHGLNVARGLGDSIGQTVIAGVPHLKPMDKPALAIRSKTLMLPLQTITPRQLAEARVILDRLRDTKMNFYLKVRAVRDLDLARLGSERPAEIQVFRLDSDTAIVCLPAEIFAEFGLEIKEASPFKRTMVITICNDRPGYVPTLKAFKEGGYEVINSRFKAGGGEAMVKEAVQMLNELKRNL